MFLWMRAPLLMKEFFFSNYIEVIRLLLEAIRLATKMWVTMDNEMF